MAITLPSLTTPTFLSIVNTIQARLRATQTSSVTSDTYSTMIGTMVNQAKREVEDAYNWSFLKTVHSVTTAAGTQEYSITSSNDRSRVYTKNKEIYDDTNDGILRPMPKELFDREAYTVTTQQAQPIYYFFSGKDSDGYLKIKFWPIPDGTYTIRVPMYTPQADLSDDTDYLTVPVEPVWLRAYAIALAERGEDGGTSSSEAGGYANLALNQAILNDTNNIEDSEFLWEVA